MDKKTIIGFILLVAVMMLWPIWNKLFYKQPPPAPPQTVVQDTTHQKAIADTAFTTTPAESVVTAAIELPKPDQPERLVRVENADFIAIFSSYGGLLKSLELKKYTVENGNDRIPVQLIGAGKADPFKAIGALTIGRDDSLSPVNYLPFTIEGGDILLTKTDSPKSLIFTYAGPDNSSIRKEYLIKPTGFEFKFNLNIEKPRALGFKDKVTIGWMTPMIPTETDLNEDLGKFSAFYNMGTEVIEQNKIEKGTYHQINTGDTRWIANRSKYFADIIIAGKDEADEVLVKGVQDNILNSSGKQFQWRQFGLGMSFILSGESFSNDFTIYAGPLDYFTLQGIGHELGKLLDMGWSVFRPFGIAILWVFMKLHSILFNYGFVITLFAIIIKLIFWPLTRKSTMAMMKMKELTPKMAELKAKFKDDPGKMNAETMKLYKEFGVNPFSSCLPMLIQLPIFWALFSVMKNTIELRGAPLAFWITDLSIKDPYYILPVIMGIFMFIQQKMTITDPKQKMMVYMMPVIFTFLFAGWPAGLVLYWTVFNIASVFEQMIIKRGMEAARSTVS
jgi:YidC/Oxa1 family membrane protein insertase